jgi:hypothetical protein
LEFENRSLLIFASKRFKEIDAKEDETGCQSRDVDTTILRIPIFLTLLLVR